MFESIGGFSIFLLLCRLFEVYFTKQYKNLELPESETASDNFDEKHYGSIVIQPYQFESRVDWELGIANGDK